LFRKIEKFRRTTVYKLCAELDRNALIVNRVDSAANAIASFDNERLNACAREFVSRCQAGHSRTDNNDVHSLIIALIFEVVA
jgi:hypothetical protein